MLKVFILCCVLASVHGGIVKRNLIDHIDTGIRYAGKLLGWNEASTVADLVTKAFAQPKENHHRKQSGSNLNTLEVETNEIKTSSNSNNDNDGVNSSSLLGNFLRIIGLNNGKLSALAINGLIFIAQMIGKAFVNQQVSSSRHMEAKQRDNEEYAEHRSAREGSPIDWILSNPSESLKEMLEVVRDKNLPDHIVQLIENHEVKPGQADCIKLLICKCIPIISRMQDIVVQRLDGKGDIKLNDINDVINHLGNVEDFKRHGKLCENKYSNCKFY